MHTGCHQFFFTLDELSGAHWIPTCIHMIGILGGL